MNYTDHPSFTGMPQKPSKEFLILERIFLENIFELYQREDKIFTVYMMTDAIESFLVFQGGVLTGEYEKENVSPVQASLTVRENDYVLSVRQGQDNAFTIRFTNLKMEHHLYRYDNIGHFWLKGSEHLRQINYRIGLIYEKMKYVGKEVCNEEELQLLPLYYFVPLRKYISWEEENVFPTTKEGVDAMIALCKQVQDLSMEKVIRKYEKTKERGSVFQKYLEWKLYHMLAMRKHSRVAYRILEKIQKGSQVYEKPWYGEKEEKQIQAARQAVEKMMEREKKGNWRVLIERPFTVGEEFTYTYHIVRRKNRGRKEKFQITTIQVEQDNH